MARDGEQTFARASVRYARSVDGDNSLQLVEQVSRVVDSVSLRDGLRKSCVAEFTAWLPDQLGPTWKKCRDVSKPTTGNGADNLEDQHHRYRSYSQTDIAHASGARASLTSATAFAIRLLVVSNR